MKYFAIFFVIFSINLNLLAYRIEGGDYFLSTGLGAHVNFVRVNEENLKSAEAMMPAFVQFNYAVDSSIGVFAGLSPSFASDKIGTFVDAGAKYWFSMLKAPYVPYLSLGLRAGMLSDLKHKQIHFSLGLEPSVGLNFFMLSKFLIGLSFQVSPSFTFTKSGLKTEVAAISLIDIMLRLS